MPHVVLDCIVSLSLPSFVLMNASITQNIERILNYPTIVVHFADFFNCLYISTSIMCLSLFEPFLT